MKNEFKLDIQVNVEEYTFRITTAFKNKEGEFFYIVMNDGLEWGLNVHEKDQEIFLFPFSAWESQEHLILELNKQKNFLIKLYIAIRNHPSCRLKMLNILGPIKQY